jgi:GNAT superfamily N-acetyltransferase
MYRAQVEQFPEGQLTALVHTEQGLKVVGGVTTFRTNVDFEGDTVPHYYFDFIGHGYLTNHEPDGAWLYGVDISIHPDYRRKGIGSRFYDARRELVRRLNLRGELVAGLMPGYERYRGQMSVEEYARRVVTGELSDPTLSMQLKNGFVLRRLLTNYVIEPRSDNVCTLLVRENKEYKLI